MPEFSDAALALIIALTAAISGGLVSIFWDPPRHWRTYIQHTAAGLLMAIIAVEVFPRVLADGRPAAILFSFAAGGVLMVGVKAGANLLESRVAGEAPLGRMITAGIDTLFDGLIVGVGLVASHDLGVHLALALSIDLFVLLLSIGSEMKAADLSRKASLAAIGATALMLGIGIVVGLLIFRQLEPPALAALLAFAVTALLYLITEELLVKEHAEAQKPFTISAFYLGFLGFMVFTFLR
jgi:zinc transporter, ZIP family